MGCSKPTAQSFNSHDHLDVLYRGLEFPGIIDHEDKYLTVPGAPYYGHILPGTAYGYYDVGPASTIHYHWKHDTFGDPVPSGCNIDSASTVTVPSRSLVNQTIDITTKKEEEDDEFIDSSRTCAPDEATASSGFDLGLRRQFTKEPDEDMVLIPQYNMHHDPDMVWYDPQQYHHSSMVNLGAGIRPVGSDALLQASMRRRERDPEYFCPHEGCGASFTAKHNLKSRAYTALNSPH
ncbi:hypothetical protein MPER_12154 [Moniliophthora perniciosa FA553]|nr:hypothetical protein MPER_12154 [Moniliophthora perniciosa FA553]